MWAGQKTQLPLSPLNSRALLCTDHKAHHYSAALRAALAPTLKETVQGQQSGAVKGGGTEFPMFIARLFLRHVALRRVSVAVLLAITKRRTIVSWLNWLLDRYSLQMREGQYLKTQVWMSCPV